MKIRKINTFNSAWELIDKYDVIKETGFSADEDDICFLQHFDDFEAFNYVVFDDFKVVVIDAINGDVIGNEMTMGEFWKELIEMLNEDREEREQ